MEEIKENMPLVSVPVIAYNSSKTILETLESIKAQTYPNIELIISDDCSKDNTIDVCRKWLEHNKDRFVRTEILTVEKNTGVSGNCNRARFACKGDWVKGIAGDDMMLPNCIQDYVAYVKQHPDTIYLFGRCKAFGADEEKCREVDSLFDYSFFSLSTEQQLHYLLFKGNCIPATTNFYNRQRTRQLGVLLDERVPLIEDWPMWINVLRKGVKFHFVDKETIMYRINGMSNKLRASLPMYRSERLLRFYYMFPAWIKEDEDKAIQQMVDEECDVYQMLLDSESDTQTALRAERNHYKEQYETYYKWYNQIRSSKAYRLGKTILKPFKWFTK